MESSIRTVDTESDSSSTSSTIRRTTSDRGPMEINFFGLFLVLLPPLAGGFLYGFDIGGTSFVLSMLLNPPDVETSGMTVWWTELSSTRKGLIVSGRSLGALLGSHVVLVYLSKHVGRRMELRLCAAFYMIGAFLNIMSGTILKESMVLGFFSLFLGRVVYGMGVGFVMHAAPAYLAEMSPHKVRGAIVSAKETVIVGGILVGYTVGNFLSGDPFGWIYLYGICGVAAVPIFALTYCIPESKRWLLMQGLDEEASGSMRFLYNGDISKEFETLVETICTGNNYPSTSTKKREPSLLDRRYRKALYASMGLIIFQQFSGQPSILSYSTVLFEAAGWPGNASVVSAVLMMATSFNTVMLVERVGRKFLLRAGSLIMMVSLFALSAAFWNWEEIVDIEDGLGSTQKLVILVAMFCYIAGYQVGFGPITWCIVSETFPLELRGKAIALGLELNYGLNFAVEFIFPTLQEKVGWGRTFGVFCVVLALAFFYIRAYVPETAGLTLEEIQAQLCDEEGDKGDRSGVKQGQFLELNSPTEETSLLGIRSLSFLGAHPSLEEMETQLIRKSSFGALKTLQN
jgi:sugar porter (SP) family MFS transporter